MLKRTVFKNEFGRHVATLMSGTLIGQALPIAISPILTRLYSPSDFGVFALYMAITLTISVMAAGGYEMAIMLPENHGDAANIMALSAAITLGVSLVLWVIVFFLDDAIAGFLDNSQLAKWLYIVPLSITLASFYQILSYWNNRHKQFKQLAASKIAQGLGSSTIQCAAGYGFSGPGGLIGGNIIGQMLGTLYLFRKHAGTINTAKAAISYLGIKDNARRYKKFPLLSSWSSLLDNGALQMPLFILTKFFGTATTGLFSFTFKVLTVPLFLISGAVAQVLFQKVAELHNNNPEMLRPYILRIFFLLVGIATPFTLVFMLYGEEIFSFVFGETWKRAGEFAQVLVIAAGVRFVVSPLSVVLGLNHNLAKGTAWQVTYFFTLVTVLLLCSSFPIELFLKAFVAHEVVLYAIYLALIIKATKPVRNEASGTGDQHPVCAANPNR